MKKFNLSISLQISIFLIIVAFIPVAITMALKTYEKQQLAMMESSNVQQGRLVSAALATDNDESINKDFAAAFLKNMNGRFDSRIRVLDGNGMLVADSSAVSENDDTAAEADSDAVSNSERYEAKTEETLKPANQSFVYRLFSFPIRVYRRYFKAPAMPYESADFYTGKSVFDGEEVKAALDGKYGAVTRISSGGQVSVTLYSAIPVIKNEKVCGVVLVNRSTYKILQNLYELRLDLGKIFLRSLIVVVLIAVFLAFRISYPLRKLARQASDCADKKGRIFFTDFTGKKRHDEIGELSRSFTSLIGRLNRRIKFSQAFSSDIAHEFKNPLTAIRTSAELLGSSSLSETEKSELASAIADEVSHLQTLLNGVRNISKIDAGTAEGDELAPVPVNSCTNHIIDRLKKKYPAVNVKFESNKDEINLPLPQDYFDRVAENLIDNAMSFGTEIFVSSVLEKDFFCFSVEDNGKGVSGEAAAKIFERFYSERAESQNSDFSHTGLGLSIVKAIADSLEGEVLVSESAKLGGAKFSFSIPLKSTRK